MYSKISDLKKLDVAINSLNDVLKNGEVSDFLFTLHNIAISQGFPDVAQKAGVSRESLYKTLDPNAKPQFGTIINLLRVMGMQLQVMPVEKRMRNGEFYKRTNSLANTAPDLASEWHTLRNGKIVANDVTLSSRKKVWWICRDLHEWQASTSRRVKGDGCPYCKAINFLNGNKK
jgi:probable addiction module antidote protein